ncbi:hypothetical protein As57867_005766, partial [Aphanomyces stellatus]
ALRCAAVVGPEPPSAAPLQAFADTFHVAGFFPSRFNVLYGLAETTGPIAGNGVVDRSMVQAPPVVLPVSRLALEQFNQLEHLLDQEDMPCASSRDVLHVVSSGVPLPHVDVCIVDPDTLLPVTDGLLGEIWVHGPSVSMGYWVVTSNQMSEASPLPSDALLHGKRFVRTGDVGVFHENNLFIVGRFADMLSLPHQRTASPHAIEADVARVSGLVAAVVVYMRHDAVTVAVELSQDVRTAKQGPAMAHTLCTDILHCVREHHDVPVARIVLVQPGAMRRPIQRWHVQALVDANDASAIALVYNSSRRDSDVACAFEGFLI